MMRFILITLLICLANSFNAQILKGTIKDSFGSNIPFASIRVINSTYGTASNADGNYRLELNKGLYIIKFSAFGYKDKIDTILIESSELTKDVILLDDIKEIDEVIVRAIDREEKGREIIRKAIDKRSYYNEFLNEYKCDTYCFTSLEKVKQDSIVKDSIVYKEKLNIVEWKAISYYKAPFKYKDEFIAYNDFSDVNHQFQINSTDQNMVLDVGDNMSISPGNQMASNPYIFIEGIKDLHFSIYDNLVSAPRLTQNPIISPIAFNALIYYDFIFEQSFLDSSNHLIYEINVKPKFQYETLFDGKLYIKDESWEIISYDLGITPKSLLFLNEIRIICDYARKEEKIFPVRREFIYNIKEGKNNINGLIKVYQNNYEFEVNKINWLETSVYKNDAFKKDSTFWNSKRPFSLKEYEKQFIQNQDSIISYHDSDVYLKKMDSIRNEFRLLQVIVGGFSHVNSFKKYEVVTNPLMNQIIPFGIGGVRYCFNISIQKEFKNGKVLFVKPNVDYGFLNKDIKGSIESSIMYNRLNFSKIGFTIGDVYDVVSNTQNMLTSFVPTNRVRNKKVEINYSREVINGLYAKLSVLYSNRSSIDSLKYPDWMKIFGTAQINQPFDPYKILLTTLDLEYHIRQKYIIKNNKKIVYKSIFPTLYLTYKKGIPNFLNSMSDFDYVEFRIEQNLKLNSFGNSNLKFSTGNFIQKSNLHIIEHRFFRPSDQVYFSNPLNTLQLLDTSINTSNSYFQMNFIHHFNGFFLNKIVLLNRLKLEETFGGSFLSVPSSNFSQFEVYVGLEKKVRIKKSMFKVGLYAVNRTSSTGASIVQYKIGFNIYNVFSDKWDY